MAIYEFICRACDKGFELMRPMSESSNCRYMSALRQHKRRTYMEYGPNRYIEEKLTFSWALNPNHRSAESPMNQPEADKAAALEKIAQRIASCRRCRLDAVGKPVVGEGNPDAEIVFVDEAPGRKEAESGRPFVGRAGQWLRRSIRNLGLDEGVVYLTSPIKYRRVRRKPRPADIAHGRVHLFQQLEIIDPKIVVLLGRAACLGALNEHVHVRDRHGSVIHRGGRTYLITYHPAAAARFPAVRKAVLHDFRKLKALVGQVKDRKSA